MPDIEWTVTEPSGEVKSTKKTKHPFVAAFKVTDDMSEGQKATIETFNSMRQMLLDNDLMNKK
ncbi:hypothetical protein PAECIP111893_02384 [Paenibacillus plantiphilus]|uniref:Uncharacterized protein n=1 Tax=Paenibacillus plantiphilus TaxID=2905650 RepID=A0ABN8GCD5_9BACL|nr:hypothetical protein [Paenibacillus plantiphilus]CAH1205642.1 hypothetical protein PAECIP111893_02384 [Paenibacillus plantiphilus]